MRGFVLLMFLHSASAVIHSLRYFYAASSGLTNVPEFVAVGQIDGVDMVRYDSNTRRAEPKQDWMKKVTAEDPQYWERETQSFLAAQQTFRVNIETLKQRFNQTGGVHTLQKMFGCEWDDHTGEVDGFMQFGYDGEDFLAFALRTQTWVAAVPQAVISKHELDRDTAGVQRYLTQICPGWIKKYLNHGRSFLLRTDIPSMFLLQKTPSSPITCMATSFYPGRSMIFWRRDGEELYEGVEMGEILPNHDGSFQSSAHLDPPSDDWGRYECVFQLAGLYLDVVTRLDRAAVRSNPAEIGVRIPVFLILAILALLSLVTEGVFVFLRRKNPEKLLLHLDFGCSSSEKPPDYDMVVNARPRNCASR